MGACCSNNSSMQAEEFVLNQIKNPSLKLQEFDYNRLLNEIVSKRVQQEIYKEHIIEYLFEEFYNTNLPNEEKKYSKAILEKLIEHLNSKNNMYMVILTFYPLINHEKENCDENLYSIFNYITGRLTIDEFEKLLVKYFTWNTYDINVAIEKTTDDEKIKNNLNELNISFYNEGNIKNVVDRVLSDYKKKSNAPEKDLISKEQFKEIYNNNHFSTVEAIRNLVSNMH